MEYKTNYVVRIGIEDLNKLSEWAEKRDYLTSWCVRRAIKEFIKKYVDENSEIRIEDDRGKGCAYENNPGRAVGS